MARQEHDLQAKRDYMAMVARWLDSGAEHFHSIDGTDGIGRFGPADAGALAIEATALYAFVNAVAATNEELDCANCRITREECAERALGAFRYCIQSHRAYPRELPDGIEWGGTGMSPKMADQLALAAEPLEPLLSDTDRDALRRLIAFEADSNILLPFHLEPVDHGYFRKRPPVPTQRFGTSYPESNAWRATILARALLADPDHANAEQWRESMHMHLANALSTPADADDGTILCGRPLRDWHAGANLHPNFALEHHGFFHPGYVNRALLSLFSAACAYRDAGEDAPELLLRNVPELWDVQRRLILWDGRLAYPAGKDYPRYCWGQLYLLPVLVFIQHEYGDNVARWAELRLADLLAREQEANGDGAFFASRLSKWRQVIERNRHLAPRRPAPSVYYRSQVDPAYYIALADWWHRRYDGAGPVAADIDEEELAEPFVEPDCGLIFHRSPSRFASWSWNAYRSRAQGLVIPRDGDHLAEWQGNLVSRFQLRNVGCDCRVIRHREHTFDGGIATCGSMGVCDGKILHGIAFAALPDGRTTVYLSSARTACAVQLLLVEGLCLNIANDIFNDNSRTVYSRDGSIELLGVGAERQQIAISGPWLNVDDMLGVMELDGREQFAVAVDGARRADGHSLCYHEILHPSDDRPRQLPTGALVEDSAVALVTSIDHEQTMRWPGRHIGPGISNSASRLVTIRGMDDVWYLMAANLDDTPCRLRVPLSMQAAGYEILVGKPRQFRLLGDGAGISLASGEMLLVALAANR